MEVEEISPGVAFQQLRQGAVLVDVRQGHERAGGHAEGSIGVPLEELEREPALHLPDPDVAVMLICQQGGRSLRAAGMLSAAGFKRVSSVAGGTARWLAEGLPTARAGITADQSDFLDRYSRHLLLPEVGLQGQTRLQASRVLIVGAGGLGSPASLYLAAAGVGHLRLVDDDLVERSNLQRQVVHADARIGLPKVESARAALVALNPRVRVEAVEERVSAANIERLLEDVDVVVDGADNFPARYLLNDACFNLRKPLVYGAVQRFEGQVGVFDAGRQRGHAPCYRCLFPQPPSPGSAPSCAEAGVLGVVPGVIGLLQANEVMKLLLQIGQPLVGRLLTFDALRASFREVRLHPDPDCGLCAAGRGFPGYIDYAAFCAEG